MESNAAMPAVQNAAMASRKWPVENAKAASRQATNPTANQPFAESVNVLGISIALR